MDASNGQPVDSRLVTAPTVAPPAGVRPMAQALFQQGLTPQLGLQGLAAAGFRPAQFAPTSAAGLPLFQAQAQQLAAAQSLASRKPPLDRSKGAGGAAAGRKQCNCKNSRCLKLYCECFASGRYCESCNCLQCFNNREHEVTRQSAVETILERNPNAFRPKIQSNEQAAAAAAAAVASANVPGRHLKGCNCKKSSCLKKYCECFQAGIYCSDNCKCVECKNYEDASSYGVGGAGGGARRLRYGSAPPPGGQQGQQLGPLAAAAQGVASLGSIRPGLMQPGSLGALVQQHPGLAMAAAAAAAAAAANAQGAAGGGGGTRPAAMVGGLTGLGGGGMASLPQAFSLALAAAAASGSAPQLMQLQSAAAAAAAAAAASGAPVSSGAMMGAPGGQQLAAAPPAPTPSPPPLPLRAKMQEVVNGMVKRTVIEELCRLLWMVADDEAAPARSATTSAAAAAASNGGAGGGAGATPAPEGVPTVAPAVLMNGAASAGAAGGGGMGGVEAPFGARKVKEEPLDDAELLGGPRVGLEPRSGGALAAEGMQDGVIAAAAEAATSLTPAAALEDGPGPRIDEEQQQPPNQPQQQPSRQPQQRRRPGPLYGRKERVVLEEFLSIMNKISDTAAKKLQQHGGGGAGGAAAPPQAAASAAPPSAGQHPPQLTTATTQQQQHPFTHPQVHAQSVPVVLAPGSATGAPGAPPLQQQQQPGAAAATLTSGVTSGVTGPAFAALTRAPPGSQSGGQLTVVAPPGFANGQILYPLASYPAGGVGPSAPSACGAAGVVVPEGVAVVAPTICPSVPLSVGPAASASNGGSGQQQQPTPMAIDSDSHQPPHQQATVTGGAAGAEVLPPHQQQQHVLLPQLPQHMQSGVPVILAPPRGSNAAAILNPAPQQLSQPPPPPSPPQKQLPLHASPFLPYSRTDAAASLAAGQQQQQLPVQQPQQQPSSDGEQQRLRSQQLQQPPTWAPSVDTSALLQAPGGFPQPQNCLGAAVSGRVATIAAAGGAVGSLALASTVKVTAGYSAAAADRDPDREMADVDGGAGAHDGGEAMETAAD